MMKWFRNFLVLGATVGSVGTGYWLYLHLQRPPVPRLAVLRVESEPSNAEIWIDGKQVGRTPLVVENDYPLRQYEVLVRKKGMQPWSGLMFGGVSTRLDARLGRER